MSLGFEVLTWGALVIALLGIGAIVCAVVYSVVMWLLVDRDKDRM